MSQKQGTRSEKVSKSENVMSLLGIDLGTKYVGIAVSDELESMAHPAGVLQVTEKLSLFKKIAQVVQERKIKEIVIGMPTNMNGSLGPKAQETLVFVERLKAHLKIPIHLWDERLTTLQSKKWLVAADVSRTKRKRVIDALSAQILLQNYLDRRRHVPS